MTQLAAITYSWHQTIWRQLQAARKRQHLPHALLFSGQTGCGHEHLVYAFAESLLCLQPESGGYACKQCRSCNVFAAKAHPDFMLLETAEDKQVITVEQVRGLDRFLELSRSYSPNRVAVILNADTMNVNAANGLLKSLEEPANNSYILLFTANRAGIMPTVRSRCQQLSLMQPNQAEALSWLQEQILEQPANDLLALARGRPLAALHEDSGERLTQQTLFLNQLKSMLSGRLSIVEISTQWEKYNRQELVDWQLAWIQQLIHQEVGDSHATDANELIAYLRPSNFWQIYDRLLELKALATHPLNGRLFVENMLSLWL
ncbi:MAG: DNA polymerase III subunit delta' [Thiolinea sp.]|jgi:DNA polymerase III subunit delta'